MSSIGSWLFKFVQKVLGQLVLTLLKLLLCDVLLAEDGQVQAVFLGLEEMQRHEVDNLGGISPGPRSQIPWPVDVIGLHVVVEEWVEVLV